MNGAELFVNELKKRDVPFIATLCGHGMNLLDKACRDLGLRLIDVRNEQAAGYMAEATGRPAKRPREPWALRGGRFARPRSGEVPLEGPLGVRGNAGPPGPKGGPLGHEPEPAPEPKLEPKGSFLLYSHIPNHINDFTRVSSYTQVFINKT